MIPSHSACILIPAFNAEQTIASVVSGVLPHGLEPVVVDDGSTDHTAAAALAAGAGVLRHSRNRGKGHALVSGFRWALERGKDHVVTMDADGQHDPHDLPALLQQAREAALVIGHRKIDLRAMPRTSFIGNCISTFWISLFCGRQFPDTQCGYRVYSRGLLQQIPLRGGRFETETEILMRASLLGLAVQWVPVQTIYDNGITPHSTNFHNLHDTLRVIRTVLSSPHFPRQGQ